MAIFRAPAPRPGASQELVGDAEAWNAPPRPALPHRNLPTTAEHHHHEGVDDVALAEILGLTLVDRDSGHAPRAIPRIPEPDPNVSASRGGPAIPIRPPPILRFLRPTARISSPRPGIASMANRFAKHRQREQRIHSRLCRLIVDLSRVRRAGSSDGLPTLAVGGTGTGAARACLQDQRQNPRSQQRFPQRAGRRESG